LDSRQSLVVRPPQDEADELLLLRWHEDDGLDRELREWSPVPCVFHEEASVPSLATPARPDPPTRVGGG
jgi:hypothetical protein